MTTQADVLLAGISTVMADPTAVQEIQVSSVEEYMDGINTIVDPSNPYIHALEICAVGVAAAYMKMEVLTRRQYASAAATMEDLYLHMSDRDFVDRFAQPSNCKFGILVGYQELLDRMVLDPETGIRKVVIPRNSYFTVADTIFSLQYPIEIRQMQHGALSIVYNTDIMSPLQELVTNEIIPEKLTSDDGDFIQFFFDTKQLKGSSFKEVTTMSKEFNVSFQYTDKFHYARVYYLVNGVWTEMRTTHTDQIYDRATYTAVLKVADDEATNAGLLNVRIPYIYIKDRLKTSNIRVDIFTTKGDITMFMSDYAPQNFVAKWEAYDTSEIDQYVRPLSSFVQLQSYSSDVSSGGGAALTFDQLRDRVLTNSVGVNNLPVTDVQAKNALQRRGYQIITDVDNVTGRVFLASKAMPQPVDDRLITAASASIETMSLSMSDAVGLSTVIDNNTSITITPKTLYKDINNIISFVSDAEVAQLLAMPVDKRALAVTAGNYLYTPFHYVLDTTGNEFAARPYYLDDPVATSKTFDATNDTTLLNVSTANYFVEKSDTGYRLQITTKSGDTYKTLAEDTVFCQLAFVPAGEKDRAYMMGTLIGKTSDMERVYSFDLSTNFNINGSDELELLKFFMYDQTDRIVGTDLTTKFDIIYSTSSTMSNAWVYSSVDDILGRFLLPTIVYGITHETLTVEFGKSLTRLWARARTVASVIQYQTYPLDVQAFYTQDVYKTDPETGSTIEIIDGEPVQTLLHAKGDPVIDSNGDIVYVHRAGDIVYDAATGLPIPVSDRSLLRQVDLMLIEGAYIFATDDVSKTYRDYITSTVMKWITGDLEAIAKSLIEQTRIYFYPQASLGSADVLISNNIVTTISAAQSFIVDLDVRSAVKNNPAIRDKLTTATIQTISTWLSNTVVAVKDLIDQLDAVYGSDVISFKVSGLGGDANLSVITMIDNTQRCSIKKRLKSQTDNQLMVEEAVDVNFNLYELKT